MLLLQQQLPLLFLLALDAAVHVGALPGDDGLEPGGPGRGPAAVAPGVAQVEHGVVVDGEAAQVPEQNVASGVTKGQHGVLPGDVVQAEAHEELRAAVGRVQLEQPRVLRRALGRRGGRKVGAREPRLVIEARGHDRLRRRRGALRRRRTFRGEALDAPEHNDVVMARSGQYVVAEKGDAGGFKYVSQ